MSIHRTYHVSLDGDLTRSVVFLHPKEVRADVKYQMEILEPGQTIRIDIIEMTEDEILALPQLDPDQLPDIESGDSTLPDQGV